MVLTVKITKKGLISEKKFKWPISKSSSQTLKQKIEAECRSMFHVSGGGVTNNEGVDVEDTDFIDGGVYVFTNSEPASKFSYILYDLLIM